MTVSIRFDAETEKRLHSLAKMTGRSKSYYIRKAVEEMLEEMEDLYIALQRLEKPGRIWTLEEIRRGDDLKQ